MGAAVIMKGLSKPITYLNTFNVEQMQAVFRSNSTWVVLCKQSGSEALPEAFTAAAKSRPAGAVFGVLDCNGILPSGSTVYDRFHIDSAVQPTAFVTVPGLAPTQAQSRHLASAKTFSRWITDTVVPRSYSVASTKELSDRCLNKEACALLLKAGPLSDEDKEAFKAAMHTHRALRFASVDSTALELSVESKLQLAPADGNHIMLYFSNYTSNSAAEPAAKGKKGTARWGLQSYTDDFSGVSDWLHTMRAGTGSKLLPVTRLITVRKRKAGATAAAAAAKKSAEEAAKAAADPVEAAAAAAAADPSHPYSGKTKEQILLEFAKRKSSREAAKRRQMDAAAADVVYEADEQHSSSSSSSGGADSAADADYDADDSVFEDAHEEVAAAGDADDEDVIDLDSM
jgi:hypothetical protein